MYIYNVTINIQESVHHEWLQWMKSEHIPNMLKTGKFIKALMTRVLVKEAMGGITYSIQFTAESREKLEQYHKEDAEKMRDKSSKFEGKFVAFRTELEIIAEKDSNNMSH